MSVDQLTEARPEPTDNLIDCEITFKKNLLLFKVKYLESILFVYCKFIFELAKHYDLFFCIVNIIALNGFRNHRLEIAICYFILGVHYV